jgi:alpha-D-ribose 1-methylphosphonate 5-triphosphate diphosphatase PhnM
MNLLTPFNQHEQGETSAPFQRMFEIVNALHGVARAVDAESVAKKTLAQKVGQQFFNNEWTGYRAEKAAELSKPLVRVTIPIKFDLMNQETDVTDGGITTPIVSAAAKSEAERQARIIEARQMADAIALSMEDAKNVNFAKAA